jgi:signal transduction histidine kinase
VAVDGWQGEESLRLPALLATRLFSVPIAFSTSASGVRTGEGLDLVAGAESLPFEREAAKSDGIFVVSDAERDPRFRLRKPAGGSRTLRFYATARPDVEAAERATRFSIMDFVPRKLSAKDRALLSALAAMAHETLMMRSERIKSLRRLAYGITHDLNNILSIIDGYIYMALEPMAQDDPLRRFIEGIRGAAESANNMNLALSRFSAHHSHPEIFNLNDLISLVREELRRHIGEDIELELQLEADLGAVQIDRDQIKAGLFELSARGLEAMPAGGSLIITTRNVLSEHVNCDFVMLSVTDTGDAMDASTMEQVFEHFGGRRRLGLPALGAYVEEIGGHVRISSEPGRGSTFDIYLPRFRQALNRQGGGERHRNDPDG